MRFFCCFFVLLLIGHLPLADLFRPSSSPSSLRPPLASNGLEAPRRGYAGCGRPCALQAHGAEIRPLRIRGGEGSGEAEGEEEIMGECGNVSREFQSEEEDLNSSQYSQDSNFTTIEISALERSQSAGYRSTDFQQDGEDMSRNDDDVRGESSSSEMVDEDGMPYNTNYTELDAQLKNETDARRGCRHYSRGCRLRAPCCNELFWCRHCHNEVKDAGCKDPLKAHQLDRFSVKFVRCSRCDLEQTTKQFCEGCGLCFGAYYCDVCKFYDDDLNKGVFHCNECGICRIGGKENFFHCLNCGCCYAMQLRDNHRCIAGAMRHNCPVCLEDLFHSTSQVRVLRCGHTLHKKCLEKLLTSKTIIHTCPLCSKTLIDHTFHWRQMDLALAQTPMPEEFANKSVGVLCNDCQTKGTTTFHVLGLKCPNPQCGGYNTRRIESTSYCSFPPGQEVEQAEEGEKAEEEKEEEGGHHDAEGVEEEEEEEESGVLSHAAEVQKRRTSEKESRA